MGDNPRLLYINARHYVENQQKLLKLRVGCELIIIKRKINYGEEIY